MTGAARAADARLLGFLALLYFAQGLPAGLLGKALPALLRDAGISLSAIGFTALLAAPWALKFLWAPFVERAGTRRCWLLGLNALTLLLMLLLAARDFGDWVAQAFVPLLGVLFLLNLTAATQDIVTDGLAVSRLAERLRGLGNSVQVIGYKVGMILGSAGLLWLVGHYGWTPSYATLAGLLLLVLLPVWFMRESSTPAAQRATHPHWQGVRGYAQLLRGFAARPGLGWWLAVVALYKVGDSLASRMIGPLLSDAGMALADIGILTGYASLAGLAGAFAGGVFLLRLGHRNALLGFGLLQAAGLAGYAWLALAQPGESAIVAVACFEQFADGLSTVALFTLMMDACRTQSPGTDYTLQASLFVTIGGVVALGSGVVAEQSGYVALFAAGSLLTLLALLPALQYFRVLGRHRLAAEGA